MKNKNQIKQKILNYEFKVLLNKLKLNNPNGKLDYLWRKTE